MTKRVLLAGLLGGIAMFVWASLAHMVLGLGSVGIKEIPNEQAILGALQTGLGNNAGLYIFPAMGREGMAGYQNKLDRNPSGLLVYHPAGAKAMEAGQLVTEFLTELVEALLAVFLLSRAGLTGFASRVGFVTLIGVLASIATNVPYWNWYGYPASYTAAYMFTQIVNFLLVGVVAALVMRPRAVA
jgi:hypothetical protein